MTIEPLRLDQRPTLSRAARLRYDAPTRSYVLLSPERGLRLNDCASEVVLRCNGELTVRQICAEMLLSCAPPVQTSAGKALGTAVAPMAGSERHVGLSSHRTPDAEEVTRDILELLIDLRQRQLLFFDAVL